MAGKELEALVIMSIRSRFACARETREHISRVHVSGMSGLGGFEESLDIELGTWSFPQVGVVCGPKGPSSK